MINRRSFLSGIFKSIAAAGLLPRTGLLARMPRRLLVARKATFNVATITPALRTFEATLRSQFEQESPSYRHLTSQESLGDAEGVGVIIETK